MEFNQIGPQRSGMALCFFLFTLMTLIRALLVKFQRIYKNTTKYFPLCTHVSYQKKIKTLLKDIAKHLYQTSKLFSPLM